MEAALATEGVGRVITLKTVHVGPDSLLVGLKIEPAKGMTAPDLADTINAAEAAIRQAVPTAEFIYVEPDLYRADYGPSHGAT